MRQALSSVPSAQGCRILCPLYGAALALFFASCALSADADPATAPTPPAITFEEHIRPIFKAHCFHCHGAEGEPKSGLDVRLRRSLEAGGDAGPALLPGKRDESPIFVRTLAGEMPPGDHKLTAQQIELIGQWIDAGAPTKRPEPENINAAPRITPEDRQFWAFQPVTRPEVPKHSELVNPVDRFLIDKLTPAGLAFSPPAERLALLLRASFDLTGLPPSLDEARLFLADTAPDAYERLIDRLLASPHYGERWGRHWLDVAGYAESDGYVDEDRPRPYAYKYRDYVIRAFNSDKPLDAFIVEQLAGDELLAPPYANLNPDQIEKLVATGFLRMAADGTGTAAIDEDLARNATMADTIKIVSTSLLGLSVGCAQCHDHRYDPILHTDYYRLRAVFEPAYNWKAWRSRPERLISLYTDADRAKAQEVNTQVAVVAQEREQKQSEFMAAALEKELEKFPAEQRDALRAAYQAPDDKRAPEQQKLLDDNPSLKITPGVLYQYNQAAADELKKFDARIGELQAQKPVEDFIQALTEVPGQVPPTFLFHRGDHRQPQQELPPGGLAVCSPSEAPLDFAADAEAFPTTGRRLAYARWLTSGQHPLVARVLVNRVWMHHFGQGIVGTPSDFGQMGQRPTHPELLDYLASELVEGGWRLKRLHKLMMTSAAYRQSSQIDEAKSALDPDNRLLWRYPVRRFEAEMIRDRVLAVSGALDRAMFGASVPVTQDNVGQIAVGPSPVPDAPTTVDALLGDAASRRSIYLQVRRSQPVAMLRAFDAPVMETNCDRRPSSTVSPQSLVMMNSAFLVTESRRFAWRVRLESGADRAAQIDRAWRLAYCRSPAEHERKLADDLITRQIEELAKTPPAEGQPAPDHALTALASLCQVLMSANEFLYVE